ncbi:MAG: isochorismatase family protein [Anaerolineaceae bacterium]|nr:MAG: isochorismatase family protein [Anaerolineaceae bacterium]
MKRESYFTHKMLFDTSHSMLDALVPFRARHTEIVLHLGRAALLVLDMQNYFLREDAHAFIPSAPAILPNIQKLISEFESHNRPIVFTRHVNTDADAGMMSRWWRNVIRAESPDSLIHASLDTSKGIVLEKTQYDAFHNTSLEDILRGRGVEQVIVTGVMTHLCCESTARSAFMRGFEVLFCLDGTATYTEAFHRSALLNLSHGFAIPVLCEEVFP